MNSFSKLYRIFVQFLSLPIFLSNYFDKKTGKEYGVGLWTKFAILLKMIRNNTKITSGSSFIEHIFMATTLLNLPPSLEGVVVECGTYKGVSAANLSLICALVNRRLEIFDSFEGLPEPAERDQAHILLGAEEIHTYEKGWWQGGFEEVKANITRYGNITVCHFHKGYFHETLPHFKEPCVQIWLDVDYRESLETCLKFLWPLLREGCYLYTHEARHMEIASLFYSESWWKNNFSAPPPGLVGAGTGLGIKILTDPYFASSIAYTVKNPPVGSYQNIPQIGGLKLTVSAAEKLTTPGSIYGGS